MPGMKHTKINKRLPTGLWCVCAAAGRRKLREHLMQLLSAGKKRSFVDWLLFLTSTRDKHP